MSSAVKGREFGDWMSVTGVEKLRNFASVLVCWDELNAITQVLDNQLKVTVYQNVHEVCWNLPDGDGYC
jgi:hypothetical protein